MLDTQKGNDVYDTPVVFGGVVMIGISGGGAELASEDERYAFHGNFVLLDEVTGARLKKTWTIPPSQWSQGYAGAYNRKRTENGDGAFGGGFVAYGEGYIRMNAEVHYLLPITPYARRRQGDSDHEVMARYSWRLPMPVTDSLDQRPASIPPEG